MKRTGFVRAMEEFTEVDDHDRRARALSAGMAGFPYSMAFNHHSQTPE